MIWCKLEQDLSHHAGAGGNSEERGAAEARRLEQEALWSGLCSSLGSRGDRTCFVMWAMYEDGSDLNARNRNPNSSSL